MAGSPRLDFLEHTGGGDRSPTELSRGKPYGMWVVIVAMEVRREASHLLKIGGAV